jgi:hypothetical protein
MTKVANLCSKSGKGASRDLGPIFQGVFLQQQYEGSCQGQWSVYFTWNTKCDKLGEWNVLIMALLRQGFCGILGARNLSQCRWNPCLSLYWTYWPFLILCQKAINTIITYWWTAGRVPLIFQFVRTGAEYLTPTRIRLLDHPAHSETLYWLSCPGSHYIFSTKYNRGTHTATVMYVVLP